jgi:hypothetical protein
MTTAEILSLKVQIDGVRRVIQDLDKMKNEVEETAQAASNLRAAVGGAAVAGAAALAGFSLRSYEQFAMLQQSMENVVGVDMGGKLASQIQEVAQSARSSGAMLQEFAQNWMMMVQGGETSVVRMMKALDKLGAGAKNPAGAAWQLAQIASGPKLMYEDLRQLGETGFNMAAVQKQLGGKNLRQMSGMDTQQFLSAVEKAAASMGDQAVIPTRRFLNLVEKLNNALAPTGRIIAVFLAPFLWGGERIVDFLSKLNKVTGGLAGLAAIGGSLYLGFRLLQPTIMKTAASLLNLARAAGLAAAAQGGGGGGFKLPGLGQGGIGGLVNSLMKFVKPLMNIGKLAKFAGWITLVMVLVEGMSDAFGPMSESLGRVVKGIGNWARQNKAVQGIIKAFQNLWDLITFIWEILKVIVTLPMRIATWLGNKFGDAMGVDKTESSQANPFLPNHKWTQPQEVKKAESAERPSRRSDLENLWNKAYAQGFTG